MTADDATEVWTALLDQIESVLADRRTRFESMGSEGIDTRLEAAPDFLPPTTVPPLPVACRPRAIALSRRNEEFVAELTRAAARVEPAGHVVRGRVTVGNASSAEFDEMA